MSGKSQTIGDFTFADRPRFSADISDNRQKSVPDSPDMNLAGNGKCFKN